MVAIIIPENCRIVLNIKTFGVIKKAPGTGAFLL
jgi:hypothetical protein